jgi:hypothetical protein
VVVVAGVGPEVVVVGAAVVLVGAAVVVGAEVVGDGVVEELGLLGV